MNSPSDVVASAPLDNGVCETAPGNGVCTLRAAIMKANHLPGGGATVVLPPGTSTLGIPGDDSGTDETTGDLNITASMSIEGAGPGATIIDGNGSVIQNRVFTINNGVNVTISGVTIRGGNMLDHAGAIQNFGTLTLSNSVVTENNVYTQGPRGTLIACDGCGGGAIWNSGTLTLINSTVKDNTFTLNNAASCSRCGGGGIFNFGTTSISSSTISGNRVIINFPADCTRLWRRRQGCGPQQILDHHRTTR